MRLIFEQWAMRNGSSIRRREDRPERYLLAETERHWQIWQAALAHGRRRARPAAGSAAAQRELILNDVMEVCLRMGPRINIDIVRALVTTLMCPAPAAPRPDESDIL